MTNQEPPVPDAETDIVEVDVRVIIPPWLYDDFHRYHAALCEAGRPDLAAQLHVRVDETGWLIGLAQDTPLDPADVEVLARAGQVCGADAMLGHTPADGPGANLRLLTFDEIRGD